MFLKVARLRASEQGRESEKCLSVDREQNGHSMAPGETECRIGNRFSLSRRLFLLLLPSALGFSSRRFMEEGQGGAPNRRNAGQSAEGRRMGPPNVQEHATPGTNFL